MWKNHNRCVCYCPFRYVAFPTSSPSICQPLWLVGGNFICYIYINDNKFLMKRKPISFREYGDNRSVKHLQLYKVKLFLERTRSKACCLLKHILSICSPCRRKGPFSNTLNSSHRWRHGFKNISEEIFMSQVSHWKLPGLEWSAYISVIITNFHCLL